MHYGPIPAGQRALHQCDNPPCIRPDHLFLGTQADNVRDMVAKSRLVVNGRPGTKHHGARLTDEMVRAIRSEYVPGVVTLKAVGQRFGICESQVHHIVTGKAWSHVT